MSMDEESGTHLAYYLIAFTDVLGQRQRLRELKELPTNDEQLKQVIPILSDTVGIVITLRKAYRNFFESFCKMSPLLRTLPSKVASDFQAAKEKGIEFRYFSDSIILSVCLAEENDEFLKAMTGVWAALRATAGIHISCLCAHRAVRSGIDVGIGIPFPEGEVYGPALERAVHLEGETAGYPRIAVGKELIDFLDAVAGLRTKTLYGMLAQKLAESSRTLIFTDNDGQTCLDFMSEEIEIMKVELLVQSLPGAFKFVWEEQRRFRLVGDNRLANRYECLWSYMKSRAVLWGPDIYSTVCELEKN
jgi:hypothetical protein